MDSAIFKAYDIRGIYPDQLNEKDAWKIGYATARFLRSHLHGFKRGQANAHSICVGRDMRTHSSSLAQALTRGITASQANVIDIGMIDTPQMYFAINHLGTCGGVQVTASHNPAEYNGFKISGLQAKPVGIDTGLNDIEHIAAALLHTKAKSSAIVKTTDLTAQYKKHVCKFLKSNIKPLKIAVDASNGMAGRMIPAVFDDLPLEINTINFEHTGTFKHDPNPLIEENLAELKKTVKENGCHLGLCFDGDADRLMMVDEQAQTVGCDLLTALMAPYFLKSNPNSTIVYDLRSSRVVAEEIIKHGGTPRRERVGHVFMKKALRNSHAVFGGELSGHFYYRDNYCADSGLITLVHLLNILSTTEKPLSQLIRPLRRYHSSGEVNFKVDNKQARMDVLRRKYHAGQIDYLDGVTVGYKEWWFNCRASNTEPLLRLNVEAGTKELLDEKLAEISSELGTPV